MQTIDDRRAERTRARTATRDNHELAESLARHAAVAARHLSRGEHLIANGQTHEGGLWVAAAEVAEDFFLAEVDEARERLEAGDTELPSYLALYGATELVAR